MSRSNPKQGQEVTDPQGYIARILEALGDLDPLDAYEATPEELQQRVEVYPAEQLRKRPYQDRWTWTPLQIIGHLLDAEWSIGWRTRLRTTSIT